MLTEIILRLQRKDRENPSKHRQHFGDNQSMELLLNKDREVIKLKQSGTKLVNHTHSNDPSPIHQNKHKHELKPLSLDEVKTENFTLIEVTLPNHPTNSSKEQSCEVRMRPHQTLNDLKQTVLNLLNIDLKSDQFLFYHNASGYIFNQNSMTIKQCLDDLTSSTSAHHHHASSHRLSLRIGTLRSRTLPDHMPSIAKQASYSNPNIDKKPLPPPPSKQKSKPLPPSENDFYFQQQRPRRRKSTKLDVIKSKIAMETDKKFKVIMNYIKDSPIFWRKLSENTERVRRLTSRLKGIASLISSLCSTLTKFSSHCSKLSLDVMHSWEEIENEFSGDMLSLNAQFFNLGDAINTLSTTSKMLAVTLQKVIIDEFNKFATVHLNNLLASNKELIEMKLLYETSLQNILHNKSANGDGKHSEAVKRDRCEYLRKKYELKRYDHCVILNNIINRHRYDIILHLCASFVAFESFFHSGYESALSHKNILKSIRIGLDEKDKQQKQYFDKIVGKNRKVLVNLLNQGKDFNDYKKEIRSMSPTASKIQIIPNKYDDVNSLIDQKDRERFKHVSLDYYDGYLWKQASKSKKKWQKRWFICSNGQLEYYRNPEYASEHDMENNNSSNNESNGSSSGRRLVKQKSVSFKLKNKKESIGNTALCKIKRARNHDFKFVLEVMTPSQRVYHLQAQTASEYDEWFYVLSNQCARLLLRKNTVDKFNVFSPFFFCLF